MKHIVFDYFKKICDIPHGSGNEKKLSEYIIEFAKSNQLEYHTDSEHNVIVYKPAQNSKSDKPVILQGHIDMVCEKTPQSAHNFETDPISLIEKDGFYYADDTTLGADNGIAVAYMLAILEDKTNSHPPLECVFTTNEETGMDGATALDYSKLKGRLMINLDSEEEGYFIVSCAGGLRCKLTHTGELLDNKSKFGYRIDVSGLLGGHSGMDIIKNRANANRVLAEFLGSIKQSYSLNSFEGGAKDNAIPRDANAVISADFDSQVLAEYIEQFNQTIAKQFADTDPNINVNCTLLDTVPTKVFGDEFTKNMLKSVLDIPNGIQTMSEDIKDLVQTSSNVGVVEFAPSEDGTTATIELICALRSSSEKEKQELKQRFENTANLCKCDILFRGDYPAWEYQKQSKLREVASVTYKNMFGKEPTILALHAGLECGLFYKNLPECDILSMGPDMFDVHTPRERVDIKSTINVFEFLVKLLGEIG